MTILDQPIRVDREAERISVFGGSVSIDFNGNEEKRREAMRFYEQAPAAFRLLLEMHAVEGLPQTAEYRRSLTEQRDAVLRDAGVLP